MVLVLLLGVVDVGRAGVVINSTLVANGDANNKLLQTGGSTKIGLGLVFTTGATSR